MARRIYIDASGIRISKKGLDALSSNPSDLLLDGTYRNTRVALAGTLSGIGNLVSSIGHTGTYRISATHGLGYIPLCNMVLIGASPPAWIDTLTINYDFVSVFSGTAPATATAPGSVQYVIFYEQWV